MGYCRFISSKVILILLLISLVFFALLYLGKNIYNKPELLFYLDKSYRLNKMMVNSISKGDSKKVNKLINYDKTIVDHYIGKGSTPLVLATKLNKINCVKVLLRNGANPNKADSYGMNPLHYACIYNNVTIASLLIRSGADTNATSLRVPYETPLHLAVLYDGIDIISILAKNNADINQLNEFGITPLHYAVMKQDIKKIQLLIKYGAKTNIRDEDGKIPIDYADTVEIKRLLTIHTE